MDAHVCAQGHNACAHHRYLDVIDILLVSRNKLRSIKATDDHAQYQEGKGLDCQNGTSRRYWHAYGSYSTDVMNIQEAPCEYSYSLAHVARM